MFYVWLAIVILLAIIEMSTVNLVSIWFVISGLVSMIISIFIDNVFIELSIFVILGLILMLLTKKIVKKIVPEKEKTNLDRIIGMTGIVTETITKKEQGEVKVDGKRWGAKANEKIEKGEEVLILEINSTKLIVKKVEE